MLLGDAASQHCEMAKSRATRRMIHALENNEPAAKVGAHLAQAVMEGVHERTLAAVTNRAIARRLSEVLYGSHS